MKGFFSKIFGGGTKPLPTQGPADASIQEDPNNPQKKKGFFGKIAGIFKDDKNPAPAPKPPDPSQKGQTPPH
jgi:hypothetical protein